MPDENDARLRKEVATLIDVLNPNSTTLHTFYRQLEKRLDLHVGALNSRKDVVRRVAWEEMQKRDKPVQWAALSASRKRRSEDSSDAAAGRLLRLLWTGRGFSDAVVRCGDHSWQVHRCVLAAASPVWARMLQSGMREAVELVLEIQDADPRVVGELLEFIYTGNAASLAPIAPPNPPEECDEESEADAEVVFPVSPVEDVVAVEPIQSAEAVPSPQAAAEATGSVRILALLEQASVYQISDLVKVCCLHLLEAQAVNESNVLSVLRAMRSYRQDCSFKEVSMVLDELIKRDARIFDALVNGV